MKRILLLLPLLCLISCNHPKPTTTVELIDTSLSISPRAESAALDAVRSQIQHMDRGDHLILIPVAGDAENVAGGRILRLEAPSIRQAYDADLRAFRKKATQQFSSWAAARGADRSRTDLLGSLDAARQALASSPKGSALRLVIASDFIEDDGEFNFASNSSFANVSRARLFATSLRAARGLSLHGMTVCPGRLESADFAALSPSRQQAINVFWQTYLADSGRTPEIAIDGLGMLRAAHSACLTKSGGSGARKGSR